VSLLAREQAELRLSLERQRRDHAKALAESALLRQTVERLADAFERRMDQHSTPPHRPSRPSGYSTTRA